MLTLKQKLAIRADVAYLAPKFDTDVVLALINVGETNLPALMPEARPAVEFRLECWRGVLADRAMRAAHRC